MKTDHSMINFIIGVIGIIIVISCASYKPPKKGKCGINYELRNDMCWQIKPKVNKLY